MFYKALEWEWCSDSYDDKYYEKSPGEDPQGPGPGTVRVLRGGGFFVPAAILRAAKRSWAPPTSRYSFTGFRVVRELD